MGFAWREHVPARCGPQLQQLSQIAAARLVLQVNAAGLPPFELLAVHLKSGCSREPIDAAAAACRLLARQGEALGEWIADRASRAAPFIVLGDFNRVDSLPEHDLFWQLLHAEQCFELLAAQLPFRNCYARASLTPSSSITC